MEISYLLSPIAEHVFLRHALLLEKLIYKPPSHHQLVVGTVEEVEVFPIHVPCQIYPVKGHLVPIPINSSDDCIYNIALPMESNIVCGSNR
eukprot:scaffold13561_cov81-Skeletonema_dohrnii-CCMP3373.AAC.2